MNIFLAVDDNYIYPFLITLYSAVKNSADIHKYTLAFDPQFLTPGNRAIAQQFASEFGINLILREIDMQGLPSSEHISPTTFARVFLLFEELDPFLWLDADILCLKDWDDFINPALDMFQDRNTGYRLRKDAKLIAGLARPEPVKYDADRKNQAMNIQLSNYFNAGILLLNPFAWQEVTNMAAVRELMENHLAFGFKWLDQDVLNCVVGKSETLTMVPLETTYNLSVTSSHFPKIENPRILHYQGGQKPWLLFCNKYVRHVGHWKHNVNIRAANHQYAEFEREIGLMLHFGGRKDLSDIFSGLKSTAILKWWRERAKRLLQLRWWIMRAKLLMSLSKHQLKKSMVFIDSKLFNESVMEFYKEKKSIIFYGENKFRKELDQLASKVDYQFTVYHKRNDRSLLTALCDKYGSDKGSFGTKEVPYNWPAHNYVDYYSRIFGQFRENVNKVFECGIGTNNLDFPSNMSKTGKPGASLRVWRDYFPNAQIYGADIDRNILFNEERIRTHYIDQLSEHDIAEFWNWTVEKDFDIIIDDGLHTFEGGRTLFVNSIQQLAPNGVFIIEDVTPSDLLRYQDFFRNQEFIVDYVTMFRPKLSLAQNSLVVIRHPQ